MGYHATRLNIQHCNKDNVTTIVWTAFTNRPTIHFRIAIDQKWLCDELLHVAYRTT